MKVTKRALVLAPHPDDGEFSSGGTIKKIASEGVQVWYAAFSPCVKSLPKGFDDNSLFVELHNAVKHLGIPDDNVITYDYPVRELAAHRQDILENMIEIRNEFDPEMIFLPNSFDIHQDHQVIHNEGVRAFKNSSLLGYELPWNNFESKSNLYVELDQSHLDAKIAAIGEYKSQQFRNYQSKEFFESLARVRGTQINKQYAEAFEMIRWIY
ncbi:MAG TPA: PIG-L family deacetylase [Flavobacteriales bacterium]|nr:PIG-L family deacetylase [Flavobacteriales bacterium]HIA12493.1 PIG-L family deacetylase [Flavobacteriales bacterium]HIO73706.1 PIG-L family deacetylase [Flavobacteriales bacterium]